jgi:hypothetical protein
MGKSLDLYRNALHPEPLPSIFGANLVNNIELPQLIRLVNDKIERLKSNQEVYVNNML